MNQLDSLAIIWNKFDSLNFDENPINLHCLQCHYISKDSPNIALKLNELLLIDLENDWEVFYYRARIFELMDDYKSAIEMYEKVSELFPENTFVEKKNKRLPHKT